MKLSFVSPRGLSLPTDEQIETMATKAGFTVGALVHVRAAPVYTAAPIREFTWCDGQVLAVWMGGACRTPLVDLVLAPPPPEVMAEMNRILDSWAEDLAKMGPTGLSTDDWIPDYPPVPSDWPAGEGAEDDNQDSTEYPEDPADEQRP